MSDSNNPSNKAGEDDSGSGKDIGNLMYKLSRNATARANAAAAALQPPYPPISAFAFAGQSSAA